MNDRHPEQPPFPGHRRYYVVLKIVVLVIAALLAIRLLAPSVSP
jgi:hypothetical protein